MNELNYISQRLDDLKWLRKVLVHSNQCDELLEE